MDAHLYEEIKQELEKRKKTLEKELHDVAEKSGKNTYEVTIPEYGRSEDENAEEVSAYTDRLSIGDTIEGALADIDRALQKIKDREYGVCEKCHQELDIKRLRAYPTARFCVKCKK